MSRRLDTQPCPSCGADTLTVTVETDRGDRLTPPSVSVWLNGRECSGCGHALPDDEADELEARAYEADPDDGDRYDTREEREWDQ